MGTHFTGSGDRLSHTNTVIGGTTSRSFTVWLRKTSSANNSCFQLSYGTGTWISEISTFDGDLFVTDASGGGSAQYTFTFTTDQWYHIGYTYDGTNKRVYVDGALASTQAWSSTGAPGGDGWTFGAANFTAPDVDLQDITIWNVVLTADEIAQLYRARLPRRRDNLVAHYPLFQDAARTADYSGNARTLTSVGTPTNATSSPPAPWGTRSPRISLVTATAVNLVGSGATRTAGAAAETKAAALTAAAASRTAGAATDAKAAALAAAGATRTAGTATLVVSGTISLVGTSLTRSAGVASETKAAALAAAGATRTAGAASGTKAAAVVGSSETVAAGAARFDIASTGRGRVSPAGRRGGEGRRKIRW